jgi:hypothetical protein
VSTWVPGEVHDGWIHEFSACGRITFSVDKDLSRLKN